MSLLVTVKFCSSGVALRNVLLQPLGRVLTQSSTEVKFLTSKRAIEWIKFDYTSTYEG